MRLLALSTAATLAAWLACPVLSAPLATERFIGLTNLWELRLTLEAADWDALTPVEPERERMGVGGPRPPGPGMVDREFPWSVAAFEGAGCRFTNLALRFKGNSSYNMSRRGLKRPFKLDFNRGAPGRSLLGHKELLLNNNLNDGAQFREALAYDAFRRAGLAAPRTAFAKVWLTVRGHRTNEFLGLYTVVEAVERDFLEEHWGTKKGLLVKPERLPGLKYLGEAWFGGHPGAGDRRSQADFSVLRPLGSPIRLVERVLAHPEWAAAYRQELATLLTIAFDPQRLREDAQRIARVTQEAAFAESPEARAAFERSALGITPKPTAPHDRSPGNRSESGRPPGTGLPFGREDEIGFADWVLLRA